MNTNEYGLCYSNLSELANVDRFIVPRVREPNSAEGSNEHSRAVRAEKNQQFFSLQPKFCRKQSARDFLLETEYDMGSKINSIIAASTTVQNGHAHTTTGWGWKSS
jgi:hypothetical protein